MLIWIAEVVLFIDYVHLDYDIPIIESYQLPFISVGSFGLNLPENIKILTDNIIRLEYKDGSIEHWKVRMSTEDYRENQKIVKDDIDGRYFLRQLIWWNGIGNGSRTDKLIFIDNKAKKITNKDSVKSWNYNKNTSVEPVYENML